MLALLDRRDSPDQPDRSVHRLPRADRTARYYVLDRHFNPTGPPVRHGAGDELAARGYVDAPPDIPVDPWRRAAQASARTSSGAPLRASATSAIASSGHCASHTPQPCRPPIHHRHSSTAIASNGQASAQVRSPGSDPGHLRDVARRGDHRHAAPHGLQPATAARAAVADRVEAVYITSRKYAAWMCPPARSPPAADGFIW